MKRTPHKLPIGFVCVGYLMCDHFHIPNWAWGVWWTIAAVFVIGSVVSMVRQEQVDIFDRSVR